MSRKRQPRGTQAASKQWSAQPKTQSFKTSTENVQLATIIQRARLDPSSLHPHDVRYLQGMMGNQAVSQLLTQATQHVSHTNVRPVAQRKSEEEKELQRMDYDASGVGIHTAANAVQSSRDIQAKAFKVQPKFAENWIAQNSFLGTSTASSIQRQDEENKLDRLNEMLDSFNVPEDDVITLCGQLSAPEKATVLAGGYRSRMASALNVSEMVQAVNNLGPVLSTKLEWINEAALMTRSIDYEDIDDLVRSADQSERDALKINYWKNFFVSVCTNETMVTALNDLGFDLATKLEWLQAEMTVTSLELDYAIIKPWITDPAADKTVLKTNKWRDFFVDVCDNQTMVTALNDLGFDLATKLEWLQAEMTVTSLELDYATIKPWITDPAADKTVLKTDEWRDFFVKVCTNETMVEALNDLGFDLATKLEWLQAETTVTSWELDYATIKPLITAASQAEKDALKTDRWRDFFDAVCNSDTFVEALNDLGFDPVTKVEWFQLVEIGGTAVDSDKALVIAELTKIPLIALSALKEEGVKVVVCRNSVTEIRTDLKGVRPRGWPAGKTWDTVPGLNDPNSNRVIIAIRNGKVPPAGDGHGSFNLVLHETGHAIGDAVESGGEDDPRFIAAREKDKALLDSYEGQAGHAGVEETYAESFARFYGNDPTDAATYPNLHAYWASNPFEAK